MTPHLRQLLSWYRSPVGLVSIVCMSVAVGFAVAGRSAVGLVVTLVWLGLLLPHTFSSQRRDWADAVANHAANQDLHANTVPGELSEVMAQHRQIVSELSTMPTVEEIATWQAAVERAQADANAEIRKSIDELRAIVAHDHD